jgi:hypothetical protein
MDWLGVWLPHGKDFEMLINGLGNGLLNGNGFFNVN